MKKIIFIFAFLLAVSSFSQAQNKYFKPNVDVTLRGGFSSWLSDASYKDYYKGFPNVQLDFNYNVSPEFGVYAAVGGDFISPKDRTFSIPGYSATEGNTTVISAFVGPRYFINTKSNKSRIYLDAGVGLYALKFGDYKETQTTNPPATINYTYRSVSQIGFNFGGGLNMDISKSTFFNVNIKYHNVPKKSNVTLKETATTTSTVNGVTTTVNLGSDLLPIDFPGRSYFQFAIGIGYRLGL